MLKMAAPSNFPPSGVGFSLIYLPAIATVGHWFQQRRPLAVGLALCGSGVGCLLGAQAIPRLVDWLTWRGATIILAAFSFQCLVSELSCLFYVAFVVLSILPVSWICHVR